MAARTKHVGKRAAGGRSQPGRKDRGLAAEIAEFTRQTAAGRNWGHSGLTRVLRGVTVQEAAWKPWPETHSIWEEVNHIFYWSDDVLQTLEGRGASRPQAWPAGEGTRDDWRRAIERVQRLHAALVRQIAAASPAVLARTAPRSRFSHAQRILGGASHIAYHTGRIALLRRMYALAQQPSLQSDASATSMGAPTTGGAPTEDVPGTNG